MAQEMIDDPGGCLRVDLWPLTSRKSAIEERDKYTVLRDTNADVIGHGTTGCGDPDLDDRHGPDQVVIGHDPRPYPEGVDPAPESPPGRHAPVSSPLQLRDSPHCCSPAAAVLKSGTLVARVRGVVVWIVLACLLIFMVWALLLHVLNLG